MVYIVLGKGFEEVEAVTPGDLLRRAGIETAYVGIDGLEVTGAHGIGVRADLTPEQMDLTRLDMIVLPGGLGGVASIRGCRQVMDAVRFAYDNGKYVAALCAAPTILAELHITDGREAVCYPDPGPGRADAGLPVPARGGGGAGWNGDYRRFGWLRHPISSGAGAGVEGRRSRPGSGQPDCHPVKTGENRRITHAKA